MAWRRVAAPIVALLAAPLGSTAMAQSSQEPVVATPPGWAITPSVGVSELWDDNPLLADADELRTGDFVTAVRPSLAIGYRGARTTVSGGYGGSFDFYRTLSELDTNDHRASLELKQRLTKRVSLFARDQAALSPTTADVADLSAIVLRRQTTRMNAFRGGVEATPARHTTFSVGYSLQWVAFEREDVTPAPPIIVPPLAPAPLVTTPADDALLQGGHAHGFTGSLRQRVSPRFTLGGDYELERAIVADESERFDVQTALFVTEFAVSPSLGLSGGAGYAWLSPSQSQPGRTGPALQAGLVWRGRRSTADLSYRRTFVPSFGFGGTFQNEELRAGLRVPLARWLEWGGGAVGSNSEPLRPGDPTLQTISVQSSLAWTVKRRLRIEGFGAYVFQDSGLAGGRVGRTRAGVQASVTDTVRAR
jgi:hypothetical protein